MTVYIIVNALIGIAIFACLFFIAYSLFCFFKSFKDLYCHIKQKKE